MQDTADAVELYNDIKENLTVAETDYDLSINKRIRSSIFIWPASRTPMATASATAIRSKSWRSRPSAGSESPFANARSGRAAGSV